MLSRDFSDEQKERKPLRIEDELLSDLPGSAACNVPQSADNLAYPAFGMLRKQRELSWPPPRLTTPKADLLRNEQFIAT